MTARNCPRAIPARDCVSYPPVLHQVKPCAKLEYTQGRRRQSVAKLLSKNEARRTASLLTWINSLIGNWAYRLVRWPKITNCHQYNSAARMQRLKGCAYAGANGASGASIRNAGRSRELLV